MKFASLLLNENYYSVMNWVKRGILKKVEENNTIKIHYTSIIEFKNSYISMRELLTYSCYRNVIKILNELSRVEIYPISGPTVDGVTGYLYDRSKINEKLSKRDDTRLAMTFQGFQM